MCSWNVNGESIILQHRQQRCFASIIQSKEQNFRTLIVEACGDYLFLEKTKIVAQKKKKNSEI
jgi:hypothetical protein